VLFVFAMLREMLAERGDQRFDTVADSLVCGPRLCDMLAKSGDKRIYALAESRVSGARFLRKFLDAGARFVGEFLNAKPGFDGEFGNLVAQDFDAGREFGLPPFALPPERFVLLTVSTALFGESGGDVLDTFETLFGGHDTPSVPDISSRFRNSGSGISLPLFTQLTSARFGTIINHPHARRALMAAAQRADVLLADRERKLSAIGATEDQMTMRATIPQRTDRIGTKIEDEAGTGEQDALGG